MGGILPSVTLGPFSGSRATLAYDANSQDVLLAHLTLASLHPAVGTVIRVPRSTTGRLPSERVPFLTLANTLAPCHECTQSATPRKRNCRLEYVITPSYEHSEPVC